MRVLESKYLWYGHPSIGVKIPVGTEHYLYDTSIEIIMGTVSTKSTKTKHSFKSKKNSSYNNNSRTQSGSGAKVKDIFGDPNSTIGCTTVQLTAI